jgi:phosphoribosylaminoimidazole-succinocarboxamide synthase
MGQGYSGEPDQPMPEMSDDFVQSITERYIELYEEMSGEKFVKTPAGNALERIETSVKACLEKSAS